MLTNLITSEFIFIVIMTLGFTLLAIEVFVPSFGLLGIVGLWFLVESLLSMSKFRNYVIMILISILIAVVLSYFIISSLLKSKNGNKLVLNKDLSFAKGNKKSKISEELLSKEGVVVKILRPSGEVKIDENIYNAISDGNFIEKGSLVKVVRIEGSQLYCKKI